MIDNPADLVSGSFRLDVLVANASAVMLIKSPSRIDVHFVALGCGLNILVILIEYRGFFTLSSHRTNSGLSGQLIICRFIKIYQHRRIFSKLTAITSGPMMLDTDEWRWAWS